MSPAYLSHVEKKAHEYEVIIKEAKSWLKEIINKYDLPFNSDEHNYMIAELRKLKTLLENESHKNDIATD